MSCSKTQHSAARFSYSVFIWITRCHTRTRCRQRGLSKFPAATPSLLSPHITTCFVSYSFESPFDMRQSLFDNLPGHPIMAPEHAVFRTALVCAFAAVGHKISTTMLRSVHRPAPCSDVSRSHCRSLHSPFPPCRASLDAPLSREILPLWRITVSTGASRHLRTLTTAGKYECYLRSGSADAEPPAV